MTEVAFLSQLVARTGCRLLCDVSNVHVRAVSAQDESVGIPEALDL